jgi:hypothetical protein
MLPEQNTPKPPPPPPDPLVEVCCTKCWTWFSDTHDCAEALSPLLPDPLAPVNLTMDEMCVALSTCRQREGGVWVLTCHRRYPDEFDLLGAFIDPAESLSAIQAEFRSELAEFPSAEVTANEVDVMAYELSVGRTTLRLEWAEVFRPDEGGER